MDNFLYHRYLKPWYNIVSAIDKEATTTLMNYGFSGVPRIKIRKSEEPNRTRLQLYNQLVYGTPVKNKTVLEVGSGRGGGANFITETYKPKLYFAVDFSKNAIEFCRKNYSEIKNLYFFEGNAMDVPFSDGRIDVVINVESSHGYPDTNRFLSEVYRVLDKKGVFLYTDFRPKDFVSEWRKQIVNAGFKIKSQKEITNNVLKALDADNDRKISLIDRHAPFFLRNKLYSFAGIKGSPIYNSFASGELKYISFILHKDAS